MGLLKIASRNRPSPANPAGAGVERSGPPAPGKQTLTHVDVAKCIQAVARCIFAAGVAFFLIVVGCKLTGDQAVIAITQLAKAQPINVRF